MAPSKKKTAPKAKPEPVTASIEVPDEIVRELAEKILAEPAPVVEPETPLTLDEIRRRVRLGQWRRS